MALKFLCKIKKYQLLQNEQCGICWKLKVDKYGKQTHGLMHSHDFTPFDFCIKCKQPKFDHQGFLTHPSQYDLLGEQSVILDHEFSSSINTIEMSRKKKRRIILAVTGTTFLVIAPVVNVINLFF